jgi:hypothetical protein
MLTFFVSAVASDFTTGSDSDSDNTDFEFDSDSQSDLNTFPGSPSSTSKAVKLDDYIDANPITTIDDLKTSATILLFHQHDFLSVHRRRIIKSERTGISLPKDILPTPCEPKPPPPYYANGRRSSLVPEMDPSCGPSRMSTRVPEVQRQAACRAKHETRKAKHERWMAAIAGPPAYHSFSA